jgi:hypothetical protein
MARKVGQIVRRGARTWLLRVYNGPGRGIEKAKVPEPDYGRRNESGLAANSSNDLDV